MTPRQTSSRHWLWLVPVAALLGLLAMADMLYRHALVKAPAFPFPVCQKVWAHRGYVGDGDENSLRSIQAAFQRGAAGVEIDILYNKDLGDFVVSHDYPYTLFHGKPLLLETVLQQYGAAGFFWLDAKDLRKLSPLAARRATQRLADLVHRYQLSERVLVESRSALYLAWLANKGIYTSYLISPNDQNYSAVVYELNTRLMKLGYALGGLGAISMNDYRYTPTTAATFGKVAVLLSTVNDAQALKRWTAYPQVKVILSDEDHFMLNACQP
jgi:hypothetical protein